MRRILASLPALARQRGPSTTPAWLLRQYASPQKAATATADQMPLRTGRPRLVILGSGWAAARLAHDIDPKLYDITMITPRNHMVFTPLLASTTVGTLEPRSVAVHMHDIQPALSSPSNALYIAEAEAVDPTSRTVTCRSADGVSFAVSYDKLAICTGSQGSTFGIPGVLEHAHFLRDVKQAESIRQRLIENLAKAGIPGRPLDEWQRLLHVVIVGGGPTGVEVAGELTDFIANELRKLYPERARGMRVTLVEARELLGSFDASLREYAARKLIRQGVVLRKGVVHEVTEREVVLKDGTVLPYGLCIWSTGVGPTPFTLSLPFAKTAVGRIAVDKFMRVLAPPPPPPSQQQEQPSGQAATSQGKGASNGSPSPSPSPDAGPSVPSILADESDTPPTSRLGPVPHVYALGDCCANPDAPLPALAQVAEQQGRYLARVLNDAAKGPVYGETSSAAALAQEFRYRHLGSMATVGGHSAVLELGDAQRRQLSLAGFLSWVAWRSAYLTRLGSIPKRLAVAFDWTVTLLFGRDLSRW
ncbi:hypothetical protein PLESTB_000059900 [Pleodorina starrii]|uniref:NADH:ubiquinone reductase (non-electrogenic) n=1 Tax=Pleodorina starrii TaxID=330485 RepID=A0A9W6B9N7_9CHLO|nr:hypothetical protein PLESTM_001613100 [Pleodorina starrii]GLC48107.1 hypothetical protein PLESTB_000059900 [Pleodorina starrii]GLC67356.1 hypothetical protein PLESTF_000547300 [Pleodorina starrii]